MIVVRYVIVLVVFAVATMTAFLEGSPGIDIGPVLAAAGIVGLAVGLGAQSLGKTGYHQRFLHPP